MSNIYLTPSHRSDSPTRHITKEMRKPKITHESDFTREKIYLHTITRVGRSPMNPEHLAELVEEYKHKTGKVPTVCRCPGGTENRLMAVKISDVGLIWIRFAPGDEIELS